MHSRKKYGVCSVKFALGIFTKVEVAIVEVLVCVTFSFIMFKASLINKVYPLTAGWHSTNPTAKARGVTLLVTLTLKGAPPIFVNLERFYT